MVDNFISPETGNFILNEIEKLQSTPEEQPVNRGHLTTPNEDLFIKVKENHSFYNRSPAPHKVCTYNGITTIFIPKDKNITVNIKYHKLSSTQLWLRFYPITTNNDCQNKPVVSCEEHNKNVLYKLTANNVSHVYNSILEVNDPMAVYEKILLPGGEHQISTRVRYFNPETSVHVAFKCYNTCIDVFKRTLPKLMFAIEYYNENSEQYVVLSEASIQFKVCASPARDFKTEVRPSLSKKLCILQPAVQPVPEVPQCPINYLTICGQKIYVKLISEEENKILEVLRQQYQSHICSTEIQDLERIVCQRVMEIEAAALNVKREPE